MAQATSTGLPEPTLPELRDAHESDKLVPYLKGVWERRSYIWYVALQELRARQITNVLGNLWHLLNPVLTIGVYYLIFGLLIDTRDGTDNFLLFLTVGLFIFQFTQKATIDGAKSIVNNKGVIRGIKFPRAILPLTSTITELLGSLSTFLMMFAMILVSGGTPRLSWLLLIPVIMVQTVFNLGAAMVAARMTTHFRDTTQILPFVFRLLLYGSGVIYNVSAYAEGTLRAVFILNPMYCFLTAGRWTLFGGDIDPWIFVSGIVWSILLSWFGFLWFRAAEDRYARD